MTASQQFAASREAAISSAHQHHPVCSPPPLAPPLPLPLPQPRPLIPFSGIDGCSSRMAEGCA